MRIIGGEFRGRKIKQPTFKTVRPTKDRIREAVFNIIAAGVPGTSVLDVFAGSGAYGLEALSRGAKKAVFVEKDRRCAGMIRENAGLLGVEGRAKIITKDAFKAIGSFAEDNEKFDLVFCDPPFGKDMARKTLIMVNQYDILKPSGSLIIEHHRADGIPEAEGRISVYKQRTYGDISISFYRKK